MALEGWPGEKLGIKIWDTLFDRGLAGFLRPKQILREEAARTEARRNDLLRMEQTRQDIEDLRQRRKQFNEQGNLIAVPARGRESPSSLLAPIQRTAGEALTPRDMDQAQLSYQLREVERAVNLSEIAIKAEEEAEGVENEHVSDESIDPDWFARWRTGAEDVSSDDLQRLWARVLAGELKSPGAFRLHTLDVIRRLSHKDAKLIENVAKFFFAGDAIYHNDELLNANGIDLDELFELEEIGILTSIGAIGLHKHLNSNNEKNFETNFTIHNKAIHIQAENPKLKIEVSFYKVTKVGQEILSLGQFDTPPRMVETLAEEMYKAGAEKVSIGDWRSLEGKKGIISNVVEIPKKE